MKFLTLIFFAFAIAASAQLPIDEEQFIARLKITSSLPEKLLSTKTVVFYNYTISESVLQKFQKSFQRTGIDAVAYFESDLLTTGRDVAVRVADYLNKREIANLILLRKKNDVMQVYVTAYNQKANFVEDQQDTWLIEHPALDVLLQNLYRTCTSNLRNENFLINDLPETGIGINAITGRRNEFFAIDLKVDPVAVPKFNNEALDKELEVIMQLYPYKYTLTDPNLSETELRKQGFLYVLRFAHARNKVVRNVLGYDIPRGQNAVVSLAYTNGQPQLKNISINEVVFKYYFKHIESDNVFLGTKWDADPNWQQALLNQLKGFRQEFRIE